MTEAEEHARAVAERLAAEVPEAAAYLICCAFDLEGEYERRRRKAHGQARSRLLNDYGAVLQQVNATVEAACKAASHGALETARALAEEQARGWPRSLWWCENQQAVEAALSELYDRLLRGSRPHDALVIEGYGRLGCVRLWRD